MTAYTSLVIPVIEKASQRRVAVSAEEALAALVGYNLGDGNVTVRNRQYTKNNGIVSSYKSPQAAFYSNVLRDMEQLAADLKLAGISDHASARDKKGPVGTNPHFQVQVAGASATRLINAGCAVGKKVAQVFLVPAWILNGTLGVKRAFLSALWGAEGSSPRVQTTAEKICQLPAMPVLKMCKHIGVDGSVFFGQLSQMMSDLGVDSSVKTHPDVTGVAYTLYVSPGASNIAAFFENVGYHYAWEKQEQGWLWANYLRAYLFETKRRKKEIDGLRAEGNSYRSVAKFLVWSIGKVYGVANRVGSRPGWDFPSFQAWCDERWVPTRGVLQIKVTSRKLVGVQPVFNVTVNSPDSSYLLADGTNQFNSFESMAGRVYYAFDRNVHVGKYPFNPKLPIIVGQDFNVDPMSSAIMQVQPNGDVWIVDEIHLPSSNSLETCEELDRRFFRYRSQITLYPDPAGANRASSRGESDLDIFRDRGFRKIIFKKKHPLVSDRVATVNGMWMSADGTVKMYVDERCNKVIETMEQTIYKAGTPTVDKSQGIEHMADAVGYPIHYLYGQRFKKLVGFDV